MTQYIALLRGIGPGNPNMRNDKLRSVFEALGFTNVRSVISSGNVLFESRRTNIAKLEADLEAAFPEILGFTSTVIIRSEKEIKQLIAKAPFGGHTHSTKTSLNVTFLKQQESASNLKPPQGDHYDVLAVYDREVCAIIDTTQAKTPDYMLKAEKIYGKQITTRTWQTVERIYAKLQ